MKSGSPRCLLLLQWLWLLVRWLLLLLALHAAVVVAGDIVLRVGAGLSLLLLTLHTLLLVASRDVLDRALHMKHRRSWRVLCAALRAG